eukprot:731940-Rhodomonas_salina.1
MPGSLRGLAETSLRGSRLGAHEEVLLSHSCILNLKLWPMDLRLTSWRSWVKISTIYDCYRATATSCEGMSLGQW